MGTYSDVAITVYGDETIMADFRQYFEDQLTALTEDGQDCISELIEDSKCISDRELFVDDNMLFRADEIKWYNGYFVPTFFDDIIMHATKLGLCSEILVIGTEMDDITHDYFGDDCRFVLTVDRSISVNL